MEWCTAGRAGQNGRTRHVRLVIDSRYAGLTLARMLMHPNHWTKAVIRDGFAACLPSQKAFELSSLGHSVLTYTMLRPYKNALPPTNGWTEEEYGQYSRAQRETTQNLRNGRQHALDVINGHHSGLASNASKGIEIINVEPPMGLDELREALDHIPRSIRQRRR